VFVLPLFQKHSGDRLDSSSKATSKTKPRLPLEPLELSGAAYEWLSLIVEKDELPDFYTSVAPE
jgi:hypothetical protein